MVTILVHFQSVYGQGNTEEEAINNAVEHMKTNAMDYVEETEYDEYCEEVNKGKGTTRKEI